MDENKEFKGHTLTLTDEWRVEVLGPHFPERLVVRQRTFDALSDARQAINKAIADEEKENAANAAANLQLGVYDQHGNRVTITRIDRRTGEVAGILGNAMYPTVLWVRDALIKRKELAAQINALNDSLKPLEMNTNRAYGRIDADELPRKIAELLKEHTTATEKATQPRVVAGTEAETEKSA